MRKFLDLQESMFFKRERNGELRYNCPFCIERRGSPDTKGHLHINIDRGIYHCFRCDASFKNTGVIIRRFYKVNENRKEIITKTVELPQPYYSLYESNEDFFPVFSKYAESRSITRGDIKRYNIGFTGNINSPFFGRLIFCWIENKKVTFFQGRDVIGNSPKYLSMGNKPFFSSFDNPVDCAVVTEGIFDMVNASRIIPSGAVLGHSVSPEQRDTIKYLIKKKIITVFDSDCYRAIIPFISMFPDRIVCPIFLTERKDLGEMNPDEIRNVLRKWI